MTVPQIPSITQTILTAPSTSPTLTFSSPVASPPLHSRPFFPLGATASANYTPLSPNLERTFSPGSSPGSDVHRTTMEVAALEIPRLSEELDYLRQALDTERSARQEAEAHLLLSN